MNLAAEHDRKGSGFSLVEVMIAILILGIAVAGLAQGITTALGSSKESELQATAALFAAGVIEQLRAEGGLVIGENEGSCGSGMELYRWTQVIRPTRLEGLFEVSVTVEDTRNGRSIYELQTLLFEVPGTSSEPRKGATSRTPSQR